MGGCRRANQDLTSGLMFCNLVKLVNNVPLSSLSSKGAKFFSTLALGPVGLLAPFVHLGAHMKPPCEVKSLGELGLSVPAPDSGKLQP